jgi:hypothetical protein
MQQALGTTNSPKDHFLNARRARRAAALKLETLNYEVNFAAAPEDHKPLLTAKLDFFRAQLAEEDAMDTLQLSGGPR